VKKSRNAKGEEGEDVVVDYLMQNSFDIIERNYRFGKKEIDIIARKNDLIVFVEVKLRTGKKFGVGLESIDYKKRKNIKVASVYYLLSHGFEEVSVRFDVASVDDGKLTYIENAF